MSKEPDNFVGGPSARASGTRKTKVTADLRWVMALCLALAASSCTHEGTGGSELAVTDENVVARSFLSVVGAEDARPDSGAALNLLITAVAPPTAVADSLARQAAVRALGRLEDPSHLPVLVPLLDDPDPNLRAHAADAVAQAVHRGDGSAALEPLVARASVETDPRVLAVLARSLGRITLDADARARVLEIVVALTYAVPAPAAADPADSEMQAELPGVAPTGTGVPKAAAPPVQMVGATLALESLARAGVPFPEEVQSRIKTLALYGHMGQAEEPDAGRVRALAISVLARLAALDATLIEPALRDPISVVRIAAARSLAQADPVARGELVRRALLDPTVGVRVAAIREVARGSRDDLACARLLAAASQDESRVVRTIALDALTKPCPRTADQVLVLLNAASRLGPETVDDWQVPSHALVALAHVEPEQARVLLPRFSGHVNPLVRAQSVEAVAALTNTALLLELARTDPHPNVRVAALQALEELGAVSADLVTAQLALDDPQLLLVVAQMLSEAAESGMGGRAESIPPDSMVADAVLDALERISKARRETWRDPRQALLHASVVHGGPWIAPRLTPFLTDYDAAVARQAASALSLITGTPATAKASPLRRLPIPSPSDLEALERTVVILHMRRGGTITIRPLPHLAPTNAHRFVRLAREGYFDGLTFHRAEPNYVIQGGSPGANEYVGDGPYTRDEVGLLAHWRGTVGLSTRGRDTGDAQIFINLVDNVRLNHDYTIFGIVVDGIETVDEVVAGDVMKRVEVSVTAQPERQ